jgi:DNA-binding NarL/FixJ family response regulator
MTNARLRILVVDDSDIVRRAIRDILGAQAGEWEICGEVADGGEVLARGGELAPDVLLLDLSVARVSGSAFIRAVRAKLPESALVIMSEQETSVLRYLAESFAVKHYISKSRLAMELIPMLETLARAK